MSLAPRSTAHIAELLKGIDFPAKKQGVIDYAKNNKAEVEVLDLLQHLPESEYTNMADVFKGVGQAS